MVFECKADALPQQNIYEYHYSRDWMILYKAVVKNINNLYIVTLLINYK